MKLTMNVFVVICAIVGIILRFTASPELLETMSTISYTVVAVSALWLIVD